MTAPKKSDLVAMLDQMIEERETKLKKYTPLFEELKQWRQMRARLLGETRSVGSSAATVITVDQVQKVFEDLDAESLSAVQIAEELGIGQSTVRSHLHRNKDTNYIQDDEGNWSLTS